MQGGRRQGQEEGRQRQVKGKTFRDVWNALGGRKFLAFAAACVFLVTHFISDAVWVTAFGLYVAGNVASKAFTAPQKGGDEHVGED